MILIRNIDIYSPEPLGINDMLIGGEKILAIGKNLKINTTLLDDEYDAKGMRTIPGLIDAHVHIAGAGGEGGPASRTPEIQLSTIIEAGVTSIIGCLGTDGMTRNLESVLMKVKALREEGISSWMYSGSYQVPTPTILGDVGRDLALIDEVIGIGEIALSDHRSSTPTTDELIKLVEHARVGGMLGGKAGIANIHMGDAKDPFKPIHEAVAKSELGYKQFFPTHINRNSYIFEDAKEYGKKGYVDLTSSSYPYYPDLEIKPSKAIRILLEAGVPLEHITMTSDASGSLPDFDENGNLVKLEMGLPKSLFIEMMDTHRQEHIPFEQAIQVVTSNVAKLLKLKNKGFLQKGFDADLVIVNAHNEIDSVMARGQFMMKETQLLRKGSYE